MVTSFLPPQGFGMPSVNGTGATSVQNPMAAAGSYVNQQLGGLVNGTTTTTGSSTPGDLNPATPSTTQAPQSTVPTDTAAAGNQAIRDSISQNNVQLSNLAQATGAKAAAARNAATAGGASGAVGGLNDQGMLTPWSTDPHQSAARNKALALASTYLGDRYVLGGESHAGIDCSGLVQAVYNQLGFNIKVHGATWEKNNIPGVRTSFANLQPGDLVAWKDGSHIAIYAGNGQIIEAPNPQRGVVRRPLWANPNAVIGIHLTFPGE